MKKIFIFLCFAFCILSYNFEIIKAKQIVEEQKIYTNINFEESFILDEVIVVLSNEKSLINKKYTIYDFPEIECNEVIDDTFPLVEKIQKQQMGIYESPDELVINRKTFNRILVIKLKKAGKFEVVEAIRKLEKREDVVSAEPNYLNGNSCQVSNDVLLSEQWAINKIQLPDAWDIETGSATVKVGIIDTGIDISHPDLENKVNVSLSRDFSNAYDYELPCVDEANHGTGVAGIIAATPNNNAGIAGVCWNVELVSLKIDITTIGFPTYRVSQALTHAQYCNIPIVNMSLGFPQEDNCVRTAIENYSGLVIVAAGNDNYNLSTYNYYPATYDYDNIIVVGASKENDCKADFSNYSQNYVDLFAPGVDICSTRSSSSLDLNNPPEPVNPDEQPDNGIYYNFSGTSFAAPYVTGVAALILSNAHYLYPSEIKGFILDNVDRLDSLENYCVTSGRLNAFKAISAITHDHEYNCKYLNKNNHITICRCGAMLGLPQGHAISIDDAGKAYANCLGCGHLLNLSFDSAVIMGIIPYVIKKTENGSYILSNGLIVLVEQDVSAYLNGTLTFYNIDESFLF